MSALGFAAPLPAKPGLAHVRKVAQRLKAIQIDSVNVLARAHYLPAYSRLGPYPTAALDDLVHGKRELFEYWAHAACFVPVELHPLLRHKMDPTRFAALAKQNMSFVDKVFAYVMDNGPVAASDLPEGSGSRGTWWGWGDGKRALEYLFTTGQLAIAGRRGFERLYDMPERVLSREVLGLPTPDADDAKRELLVLAAGALGIGTAADLSDYFHVDVSWWRGRTKDGKRKPPQLKTYIADLVDEGRLVPASVEGWREPAYTLPTTSKVKEVSAHTLISPFDPLVWERKRLSRLFAFDYAIEIYVPAPKRRYGYYVLPFLLGDELVARVDLKADRQRGVLMVQSAWLETGQTPARVARALATELQRMALWLQLDQIEVAAKGNLTKALKPLVRR